MKTYKGFITEAKGAAIIAARPLTDAQKTKKLLQLVGTFVDLGSEKGIDFKFAGKKVTLSTANEFKSVALASFLKKAKELKLGEDPTTIQALLLKHTDSAKL